MESTSTTPAEIPPDAIILTAAELAAHLRLGRSTVCKYAADGVIPFLQLGRRRRFILGDVLAALRERYGREVA